MRGSAKILFSAFSLVLAINDPSASPNEKSDGVVIATAASHRWVRLYHDGKQSTYMIVDKLPTDNGDGTWTTWVIFNFQNPITFPTGGLKYRSSMSQMKFDCEHNRLSTSAVIITTEPMLMGKQRSLSTDSIDDWTIAVPGTGTELLIDVACGVKKRIEEQKNS